ncbi:hypothetical protein B0H13DRAFT_1859545 [Mycena leptocephala]|nr:hypothetical protein B0H13DRAFT_1859545 [Mycena leptocephala]
MTVSIEDNSKAKEVGSSAIFDPMSSIVLSRASLIPLDNILGAWLIGLIVSSVVSLLHENCSRDAVFLKTFRAYSIKVALLMALDTLHLALLSHSFYSTTVTNFGDYVELGQAPWSLLVQVVVGDLLSALVQFFYAYRIYILSKKSLVFPVMIGICSLGQLDEAFGIAYMQQAGSTAIQSFQIKFFKDTKAVLPYSTSAFVFGVGCDVLISSAMIYHLLRHKTGFQK